MHVRRMNLGLSRVGTVEINGPKFTFLNPMMDIMIV